ncbi:MAG TPA: hypothetical protein VHP11_09365 [Tepidisphaeraceae bacterium]|nr:hypothetical protein [Tepidisphaeraceae bacterium]
MNLNAAPANVPGRRSNQLSLLDYRIGQQFPSNLGHLLGRRVRIHQENPSRLDRPNRSAKLGNLVTNGFPQQVNSGLAARLGGGLHIDAVNHMVRDCNDSLGELNHQAPS